MMHFKENQNNKNKINITTLNTRWAQMSKQEQIIEKKKVEIQHKLEAQKQAAALAAQAKLSNPNVSEEKGSSNIFSNDGSFMSQFKALLEKQNQEKQAKEVEKEHQQNVHQIKEEVQQTIDVMPEDIQVEKPRTRGFDRNSSRDNASQEYENRKRSDSRGSRDRHRRWSDRNRNRPLSPITPVLEDKKKALDKSIPSLMQMPLRPPSEQSPEPNNQWNRDEFEDSNSDQGNMDCGPMGPGPMGSMLGSGGPNLMPMLPGGPNMPPIRPGMPNMHPMPPGPNLASMLPGGPNMPPLSHGGPNIPPMPMGGVNMPLMPPGGPNMPLMPPGGPMHPGGGPMPPFMGGPPNFPMPPNFMGPNGPGPMPPRGPCGPGPMPPGGPCGPGPMLPNMCGPNGPMPPFFRPPFPNGPMMGPNCPPNSMMPPHGPPNSMMPPNSMNNSNMPFMGPRPPFGPNGPNFGKSDGPPNIPFMPPMPPTSMSDSKPLDNIPSPGSMKLNNIQPPGSSQLHLIPEPNDLESGSIPPPPNPSQVLSPDSFPPQVQRAAAEVARSGDHWENVLKAIHTQDQNMWFLHNTNSNEYKAFRELVKRIREQNESEKKPEVKPEDRYEPEFSLEDDDSYDSKPPGKEDFYADNCSDQNVTNQSNMYKREQPSSQSDEEPDNKREMRKRKKKSRWGDDPPVDVKPPGVVTPAALGQPGIVAPSGLVGPPGMFGPPGMVGPPGFMGNPGIAPPLPPGLPGLKLAKIDEEGLKLTNMNRSNPALMQYAMTNYGTTNLSVEDWKKCEDNFKLNLLYQDMLKKRQEVERLAMAGRNKYEYDSDEDTSEGTWEHRLRSKEMNATEKWATELTKQAAGKHHIGDFLPPEELKKFMENYSAVKSGKEPDLSDYKEYKLKEDNVGFKMLQKLGWTEGKGLGAEGTGIVDPINKSKQPVANMGLGAVSGDVVSPADDEFDAYRKRMMLAYRFRPNPLNNPRRPYY